MLSRSMKKWLLGYFSIVLSLLIFIAIIVIHVDPFFHYHYPNIDKYFYVLNHERNQNNGIARNWGYDTLITGTSMTENFRTSEVDSFFNAKSVKLPLSGASYKEVNEQISRSLLYNSDLTRIIRSVDRSYILYDKDFKAYENNQYPNYLYDDVIYNDVYYIFNRNIIFDRVYPMVKNRTQGTSKPGITSFDDYSNWMSRFTFGTNTVLPKGMDPLDRPPEESLTIAEKNTIRQSIKQNLVSLPQEYPNVDFYYFLPPYSIVWWMDKLFSGEFEKQLEADIILVEEILKYDNIKLFAFDDITEIITDLNHYKDHIHYASWINSLMLKHMSIGEHQLTQENYKSFYKNIACLFRSFNANNLNDQIDYQNDYYAAALLNEEIYGTEPFVLLAEPAGGIHLEGARYVENQYEGKIGIECTGTLTRVPMDDISLEDYLISTEYIGAKITINKIDDYRHLVFYGKKNADHGQPTVLIYDEQGRILLKFTKLYTELNNEWDQYLLDISDIEGRVSLLFHGGYIDNTGSEQSSFTFCNPILY